MFPAWFPLRQGTSSISLTPQRVSEKYSQCWSNINVSRTFLRCAFDVWVCCCFTMTTIEHSVWSLHQYNQFLLFSIVSGVVRVLKSYGVLMYFILLHNCFYFCCTRYFSSVILLLTCFPPFHTTCLFAPLPTRTQNLWSLCPMLKDAMFLNHKESMHVSTSHT